MIAPAVFTVALTFVIGPLALALGLITTIMAAAYGGGRAAELSAADGYSMRVPAFVGICLLNGILMFAGCMSLASMFP